MAIDLDHMLSERAPSDPDGIQRVWARLFHKPPRVAPERYELRELLGEGAFGRVFRAIDTELGRRSVALKLISCRTDAERARIRREAEAGAQLSHPNVVQVYDQGLVDDGTYFIALEYVRGLRLDAWLAARARSLQQILVVFLQIAEGLRAIHQRGLVHRDFKPSNVVVGDDGRVRVLDFGLAKRVYRPEQESTIDYGPESLRPPTGPWMGLWADPVVLTERCEISSGKPRPDGASCPAVGTGGQLRGHEGPQRCGELYLDASLSESRQFVGTLPYAAPEQNDRARAVDARTDLFSFCVALFESVYGFRPFAGRNRLEITTRIAVGEIVDGRPARPVPRWLRRLLRRGLSPIPEERPDSLDEIIERLRNKTRSSHPVVLASVVTMVVVATLAVGFLLGRDRPPSLTAEWDRGWHERRAKIGEQFGEWMVGRLDAYERSWLDVGRHLDPSVRDSPVVECMRDGQLQFLRLVEFLSQGRPASVPPTAYDSVHYDDLLTIRALDPLHCMGRGRGERPDPTARVVSLLLESQRSQRVGDYDGAQALADQAADLLPVSLGRLSGLVGFQRGMLQLQREEPSADATLELASLANGGDEEFAAEVLALRMMAAVFAGRPLGHLERLLHHVGQGVGEGVDDDNDVVLGWIEYAQGHGVLTTDPAEAEQHFRRACHHFGQAAPNGTKDIRVLNCELQRAYSLSHQESKSLLAAELALGVLDDMISTLGAEHPRLDRDRNNVALVLQLADREFPSADANYRARARRLLEEVGAEDRDPASNFEVVRARAGLLFVDLEDAQAERTGARGQPERARTASDLDAMKMRLDDRATRLEDALQPHLQIGRRDDIARVAQVIALTRLLVDHDRDATLRALHRWAKYEDPLRDQVERYTHHVERQKVESSSAGAK